MTWCFPVSCLVAAVMVAHLMGAGPAKPAVCRDSPLSGEERPGSGRLRGTTPVISRPERSSRCAVLDVAATLLNGRAAAASTGRRTRAILHNACEYAIELGVLTENPIRAVKWKAPRTSSEVDRRSVVNH